PSTTHSYPPTLTLFPYTTLFRSVKNPAIAHRPQQLDVRCVCPHQGPRRSARLSSKQFERRNIVAIPNLLRNQPTLVRRILHHAQQAFGHILVAGCQFVVAALTCQEGPGAPDSSAIEGRSVLMLSVAIAVVAIPAGTLRKPDT